MAKGFQDRIKALAAEGERLRETLRRAAAIERRDAFIAGKQRAVDIIGRVALYGSTYRRNAEILTKAAQQQPSTLDGRVAAGDLAEEAHVRRKEADRQDRAEQVARDAAAIQENYHAAAARAERRWYRERER